MPFQLKYKNNAILHLKCESTRGKSVSEDLLVVNAKPVKKFSVLILELSMTVLLGLEYLICGKDNSFVLLFLGQYI